MAKSKRANEPEITQENIDEPQPAQPEKKSIPATGLEDYGRWKEMFHNHQRDKKEPPFRRGRIWA